MAFIGIISDSKSEKIIKMILDEKLDKSINIIVINSKSVENLKNIKFETVLIANNNNIIKENKETLNKIINNTKYLIINADIELELQFEEQVELNVITFGFNPKSTITASSVEDDILLCIQRNIKDIEGKTIEQQEMKITFFGENIGINTNNLMGISAIMLLYRKIRQKN
ncbi:MAG: hypothetical protein HFJ18_03410 [Clostridia bacterium]|nr:hypothetical protein [Clostridia bacterium]MCI8961954.1 hypothetical protein [Clostridia bacterium]